MSTVKNAATIYAWKTIGLRNAGMEPLCNAMAYTIIVINAHVSFGSQLQYVPHD
jgi:hypothetical protein